MGMSNGQRRNMYATGMVAQLVAVFVGVSACIIASPAMLFYGVALFLGGTVYRLRARYFPLDGQECVGTPLWVTIAIEGGYIAALAALVAGFDASGSSIGIGVLWGVAGASAGICISRRKEGARVDHVIRALRAAALTAVAIAFSGWMLYQSGVVGPGSQAEVIKLLLMAFIPALGGLAVMPLRARN